MPTHRILRPDERLRYGDEYRYKNSPVRLDRQWSPVLRLCRAGRLVSIFGEVAEVRRRLTNGDE